MTVASVFQEKVLWKSPERALRVYRHTPHFFMDRYRLWNLRRTLRLVKEKSVFYSKKFAERPFDWRSIRAPEDLLGIYTESRDLMENPIGDFLCDKPDTAFETTGTSAARSKRVFFSYREMEDMGRVGAAGLWQMGVRPEDRVASAFDYSFWVSGPTLKHALEFIKAFHVEAGRIDPADFYERVKLYAANVLVGDPGWMVRFTEVAEKKGPWPVNLILIGGENLSETSRRYIEKVWEARVILSYGQTEAFGIIGLECREQNGYHLNEMDLWAEVRPEADGYGELVYTTLRRTVMPLIRYRSGDVTKLVRVPCPCGMRSPRLMKLRGRVDDMVVTGVGNLKPWMFEPVIEALKEPVENWQLSVKRGDIRDLIEFRVELDRGFTADGIRERFLMSMKDHLPSVYQGIRQGLADFSVRLYGKGSFVQGRKIKRIVDERDFEK